MFGMTVEQRDLEQLTRALNRESSGRELRAELAGRLHDAVEPAVPDIVSGLMSIGHHGVPTEGQPLRATVAQGVHAYSRLSGRSTGAGIRIRKTPSLRGFANAGKRLNRASFRHKVFGRNIWVTQIGKEHYFEDPIIRRLPELSRNVVAALDEMARRIKHRTES